MTNRAKIFEIRHIPNPADTVVFDGVKIPIELHAEAMRLADEHRQMMFVGVMLAATVVTKKNKNETLFEMLAGGIKEWQSGAWCNSTGEYVISSDREAILDYGCGALVWVRAGQGK